MFYRQKTSSIQNRSLFDHPPHRHFCKPQGTRFPEAKYSLLTEIEYVNLNKNSYKIRRNNNDVDDVLMWNMTKMQMRANTIKCTKGRTTQFKQEKAVLENDIFFLEKRLENINLTEENNSKIRHIRRKSFKKEYNNRIQNKRLHNQIKNAWYNEGEKNRNIF